MLLKSREEQSLKPSIPRIAYKECSWLVGRSICVVAEPSAMIRKEGFAHACQDGKVQIHLQLLKNPWFFLTEKRPVMRTVGNFTLYCQGNLDACDSKNASPTFSQQYPIVL